MDDLCQGLKKLIHNQIECDLLELKNHLDNCYKVIQDFENFSIQESHLFIGNYLLKIKINDKDTHITNKGEIAENFIVTEIQAKKLLDKSQSLITFERDYELAMQKSFEDNKEIRINQRISPVKLSNTSNFMIEMQTNAFKQNKLDQISIKQELEWQRQEIKIVKGQIKAKRQDLVNKENEIKKESNNLRNEQVKLVKETARLEKSWEEINEKQEKYKKFIEFLHDIMSTISVRIDLCNSFNSNSSILSIEQDHNNEDDEMKSLETELQELENQLKTEPKESSEAIQLKISRIKSRIVGIRSEKMMNNSLLKSTSVRNVMFAIQKSFLMRKPLPHKELTANHRSIVPTIPFTQTLPHQRSSLITSLPMNISQISSKQSSPNNATTCRSSIGTPTTERLNNHMHQRSEGCFGQQTSKNRENDAHEDVREKRKSLTIKEARLQEKEDELAKKENWIRNNLEKNFHDQEYLNLLKTEKMNLNRVKKQLEAKERNIEEKMIEIERVEIDLSNKDKELDNIRIEIDKDKIKLEDERGELLQKIEDIKNFIKKCL